MSDTTVEIKVLFFGPAKDLTGTDSTAMNIPPNTTVDQLRHRLGQQHGALAPLLDAVRLAVNESFVEEDRMLTEGDVVAIIPPVSGGAGDEAIWVDLMEEALPVDRVRTFVSGDSAYGAIVTFEGTTRSQTDAAHGALVELWYDAYGAMARREMTRLAEEAKKAFELGRVAIVHRTAAVPPAAVSVVIAVASVHRAAALEGCRWLIDTLKRDVPIWKKDVFADGFVRWVDPAKVTSAPHP